jgi:DNA polymerase III epsilon subunit-like protein
MGLDFCAIDFETANLDRGSPCAVGLVKVMDGRVVQSERWLMRPPPDNDDFHPFNVALHGIGPADVRDQPRFAERLPDILAFAGGLPFVAHNAAFDMGCMRDACDWSEISWPEASYACTLVLARRTWRELLSYSLPWVVDAAGLSLDSHHDPEADARAAANVMLAIARHHEATSLEEVLDSAYCRMGHMSPAYDWKGCAGKYASGAGPELPDVNPDADPEHPFYGQEMVFTGALGSMTRGEAWGMVAEAGGRPAKGVTKSTSILVIGYQDARMLAPGATMSRKAQKAAELRAHGQDIEIMPEVDFLQQIGDRAPSISAPKARQVERSDERPEAEPVRGSLGLIISLDLGSGAVTTILDDVQPPSEPCWEIPVPGGCHPNAPDVARLALRDPGLSAKDRARFTVPDGIAVLNTKTRCAANTVRAVRTESIEAQARLERLQGRIDSVVLRPARDADGDVVDVGVVVDAETLGYLDRADVELFGPLLREMDDRGWKVVTRADVVQACDSIADIDAPDEPGGPWLLEVGLPCREWDDLFADSYDASFFFSRRDVLGSIAAQDSADQH